MTYSIPAQCQEPQPPYKSFIDDWRESYIAVLKTLRAAAWVPVMPPDNTVPDSARQIYDMGRPKLNDRQRDQADGVARAVGNLSHFEPRLGAARFQP
jgi:hypothetical protein